MTRRHGSTPLPFGVVAHRALVLILLLALAPAMVRAQAPELRGLLSESIAPQPLSQALAELGKQSGLELFFVSEVAEGLESHRVEAGTPVLEALRQMLEGSGLQYEFVNDRAVRVVRAGSSPQKGASQAKASPLVYVQHASPLEELLVTAFNTKDPARTTPTSLNGESSNGVSVTKVPNAYCRGPGTALTSSGPYTRQR